MVVAAPTGSGKTVVAQYAVDRGSRCRRQGVLHHPPQSIVQPEVLGTGSPSRNRASRPAHRGQLGQRHRPGRRHDDRGPAQHDLRFVGGARRTAVCDSRRGSLPAERLPGPGLGGSDHPRPPGGGPRLLVGDGLERGGAGRLDRHGSGKDHDRYRGAAPGGAARPLPARRQGLRSPAVDADPGGRPAQPGGRSPGFQDAPPPRDARAAAGPAFHPPADRGDRFAGRQRHAACDLFHFQPGGMRRRRGPMRARRQAPHLLRRAAPDPGHRRGARGGPVGRRPAGARLRRVARRAGSRLRRPPRRHGPAVQGGGGELLRCGPGEGGIRHRDSFARDKHAGPFGSDREADQVHRGTPRVPDPGRVHPADGAGRAQGHRRRRLRRGAVVAVRAVRPGGGPGRGPHVRPHQQLPPDLQHGGQPGPPVSTGRGSPPAQSFLRPVPGGQRRGPAGGSARADVGHPCRRPGGRRL